MLVTAIAATITNPGEAEAVVWVAVAAAGVASGECGGCGGGGLRRRSAAASWSSGNGLAAAGVWCLGLFRWHGAVTLLQLRLLF